MTAKEKIELIERSLCVEANTLTEGTDLSTLQEWDSLAILKLQIELTAVSPDAQFDDLYMCNTIGEICCLIL
jgi:hypothetical protein